MIAGLYECFNHWHEKGTVYVISDLHFGDKELAAGLPSRPTDEQLVNIINSTVGKSDTLIVLGDCGDPEYVSKLKGYKILIAGNHDKGLSNYKRDSVTVKYNSEKWTKQTLLKYHREHFPNQKITIEEGYDFHYPFDFWSVTVDNNLFNEVYGGPLIIGEKLILSHEPVDVPWAMNLHGHIHSKNHKNDERHYNCCADVINYKPINFNQFMKQGYLADIETIHRDTINTATKRKRKREKKNGIFC